ncbi:ABC-2 family transporter protein [Paenibacillus alvei]|uniref:ABC transporter permease n=1 Tax=Paenibacillus alvei TaxID=44250 RepID=A0AAP7A067_PAEAL|nr:MULTISPECIES: ABC-2 family transporter protein [Paenibacillus]EJW19482.1 ABC-type putative transport system, permease component [Paenibacillus alvei DSM 29]MBG9735974.1 ABC transporter permease [Paenibacillus alvei]MBG9742569.1 ABC transporter permease [Paenibacillus alvei]MCY7485687.1 ABC-2 family transporter protein [Paenibacillus alvei]MCY9541310.1 ABC-2 family transporter protein [Paenibacillus alvei]
MYYFGLVSEYLKNYIKTRLTYRADFWIEIASDLLFQVTNLIFIFIVFMHTPTLAGWTRDEMVFVYGYFMIPYGIFSCFFNLWGFSERYIVKGEMDRILTRPAHNLFQILLENVDPPSIIGSIVGAIMMGICWNRLGLDFGIMELLMLFVMLIGSVMLYFGIYSALTSISFYSDAPTGILPLVWNIQSYGRYPLTIYNRFIQVLLTWILPFAFVGIIPASYFMKDKGLQQMALLTPVVGVIFFALGLTLWNIGVKRYRGAGS